MPFDALALKFVEFDLFGNQGECKSPGVLARINYMISTSSSFIGLICMLVYVISLSN